MQFLIAVLVSVAAAAFGTAIWLLDNPIIYWGLYLAFFIVCGWAARKGKKHGRKN